MLATALKTGMPHFGLATHTTLMQIRSSIFLHYTLFSHVPNSTKIFMQFQSSAVETDDLIELLNLFLDPPSFILVFIFSCYILSQSRCR